jgi:hypothetical protein
MAMARHEPQTCVSASACLTVTSEGGPAQSPDEAEEDVQHVIWDLVDRWLVKRYLRKCCDEI